MNWKIKYPILGIALWFLLFLGWEWWSSYPKVRLTPISHPTTQQAKIDSILVHSVADFLIPGLAVGIIQDEKVTYLKAFGFSDLEIKDSLKLDSQLPVASVSKIFTALALADFCLERGIPIESSLSAFLDDDEVLPVEIHSMTWKELLQHRSGLSDSRSLSAVLLPDEKRQLDLLPEYLKSVDLEDKSYQYADLNFDLIGYLLEKVSGEPFESLIQETTLKNAGMEQSFFAVEQLERFHGHRQTFLWKRIQTTALKMERYPSPSSGLIATPKDLSKALLHLCRGSMGFFAGEIDWLQDSTDVPAGFQKITLNEIEFLGHFGEQDGFSAVFAYSPDREIGIFLQANTEDKYDFRKSILEAILKSIDTAP